MTNRRPVLGYFAPLPPAPSGVADYAATMLDGLRRQGEVRVNFRGDVNLYHLGNNRLHAEHYARALAEPGMVILHDALLHHLLLGMFDEAAYVDEFVYNYGAQSRALAGACWQRRASAMADPLFFRYPLLRRVAESARLVIVHGEAARGTVLAHAPAARVALLPHLALDAVAEPYWRNAEAAANRDRFRREHLQLGAGEMLIGVYGYLRESKRLTTVLAVLDRLRAQNLPVRLLVAGSFASEDYARQLLPRLRKHPGVILRGPTSPAEFRSLLEAADVCVNLKYPAAGESSGIAARALALGVPLLLSSSAGAMPDLPAGCFVPVATGPAECASLQQALEWLLCDREALRRIAEAGGQWCRQAMDPHVICQTVWRLAGLCAEATRTGGNSVTAKAF